jgi:hypothetical protein
MSQEFITYYRDSNRNPLGVVIALRDDNDVVQFGWASCNEGDTFDKEFGLDIARARAFKGKGRPVPTSISDVVRHYNFIEKCEKFFKEEGLSILIFRLDGEGRKRAYRVTSGGSQLLEIYPVGHLDRGQEQLSENFISLIDDYAQRVVEDCDMDVLMNALKETIVERMEHESTDEILAEIKESSYDELLEDFEEETA